RRGRQAMRIRQALALGPALRVLLIESHGHRGGAPTLGDSLHSQMMFIRPESDANLVSNLHRSRPLGANPIHLDFPAVDRLGSERSGLVEPRGPEPFVDSD